MWYATKPYDVKQQVHQALPVIEEKPSTQSRVEQPHVLNFSRRKEVGAHDRPQSTCSGTAGMTREVSATCSISHDFDPP